MRRIFVLFILFARTAGGATASPEEVFVQLYGDKVRQLNGNHGKAEVEFAKRLLSDARDVSGDRAFQALLCNKAYDYASPNPEGLATAADAMGLLATISPEARGVALEKALNVLEKRYNAAPISQRKAVGPPYLDGLIDAASAKADSGALKESTLLYGKAAKVAESVDRSRIADVRDAMKELAGRQASQKHLDELNAKLKANPGGAGVADEIIRVLLYEQDRPADAAQMAGSVEDAVTKRVLPLIDKDVASLSPDNLMELGEWHQAQAAKLSDATKLVALEESSSCFTRFLKSYPADDATKLRVKHDLDTVQSSISDLGPKVPHRTVDLLKRIDPSKDSVSGTWKLAGSRLVGETVKGSPSACIKIRYQPPEEYDLKVEFTRIRGNECVAQVVSHGGHTFLLVEGGWGNTVCGVDMIDGKRADGNASTQKFPQVVKNDMRTVALIEVRNRSITVRLNGTVVTHVVTDYKNLSLLKEYWNVGDAELGLGACEGSTIFHSVRLTEVYSAKAP